MMDSFTVTFSLPADGTLPASYTVDEGFFRLSFPGDANVATYWVSNEYLMVTKYELRDVQNRIVMEATSSGTTEQEGLRVPRRIKVRFPGQERQLSVAYSSLTLNHPRPSFLYTIPDNAHTVTH
jgi:hypothetical protein